MDIEKTRRYYEDLKEEDFCDCDSCRNFRTQIKETYPDLAEYLGSMGIDIEKPYETWSVEAGDGELLYPDTMYMAIGSSDDFVPVKIGDADIRMTDSYPYTDMKEEHFVIEVSPILLKDQR